MQKREIHDHEFWVWHREAVLPSDPTAGRQILDELLNCLRSAEWDAHDVFSVHLAMEEALVNAIKHGNRCDPCKQVVVDCRLANDRVRIEITDQGNGFNPQDVPDCTNEDRLEIPSGRGVMLMKSFMSRVEYNDIGNRVVLEKVRAAG